MVEMRPPLSHQNDPLVLNPPRSVSQPPQLVLHRLVQLHQLTPQAGHPYTLHLADQICIEHGIPKVIKVVKIPDLCPRVEPVLASNHTCCAHC